MTFQRWMLPAQRWVLLCVAPLAALLFWTPGLDNFDMVKWTVVVLAAAAVAITGAARIFVRGRAALPWGPVAWAVAAFVVALVLATVTSDAPVVSLMGVHRRYSGLLLYASCALLFVAVLRRFDERSASALALAIGVGAVGMTLYGLVQLAGADPFPFEGAYSGIFSTAGNPNFAAGYLGATLPLVVWPAIAPRRPVAVRLIAAGLAAAQLVALTATNSSQGFFSAGAGLGVLAVAWVLAQERSWSRPAAVGLLAAGGLAVVTAAAGLAGVGPLSVMSRQRSFELRTYYWQTALNIFRDQPLLGAGLDRYGVNYRLHRPLGVILSSDLPATNDAAHNVVLHMLSTGGLLLGLAYLTVLGLTAWALFNGLRRHRGERLLLLGAVGGAWLGYQAQSMVSIDVPALAVLHWVLAGAVLVVAGAPPVREVILRPDVVAAAQRTVARGKGKGKQRDASQHRGGKTSVRDGRIAVGFSAAAGLLAVYVLTLPLRADTAAGAALREEAAQDFEGAQADVDRAIDLAPWEFQYWFERGRYHVATEDYRDALAAYIASAERAGGDLKPVLAAARAASIAGQNQFTEQWYREALEIEPRHPGLKVEFARFLRNQGREADAELLLREALEVDPANPDANELLAAGPG
jgi:O-antigen ligase